ncbi:hypothetical protein [Nonomuraea sp. NPDC023979]|uniref:hypothetical protein n=1 Tax=Nonomuraea sp. NPDC023979 TaxID=3154796 RepID=UPI0033E103D0
MKRSRRLATFVTATLLALSSQAATSAPAAAATYATCSIFLETKCYTDPHIRAPYGMIRATIKVDDNGSNIGGQVYDGVNGNPVGPSLRCYDAGATCGTIIKGLTNQYYLKVWCLAPPCGGRGTIYDH